MRVQSLPDLASFLVATCQSPGEALVSASSFFTCWALVVHAIGHGPCGLSLAAIVSASGGYLAYIHPRRFCIPLGHRRRYVLENAAAWTVDVLFHQMPLWILLLMGTKKGCNRHGHVSAAALLLVYLLLFDVKAIDRGRRCAAVSVAYQTTSWDIVMMARDRLHTNAKRSLVSRHCYRLCWCLPCTVDVVQWVTFLTQASDSRNPADTADGVALLGCRGTARMRPQVPCRASRAE